LLPCLILILTFIMAAIATSVLRATDFSALEERAASSEEADSLLTLPLCEPLKLSMVTKQTW
jgi:hypothetical protein